MSDEFDAVRVTGGDDADDVLLTELRAMAAQQDPVPQEAVAAARSAIAWLTMDTELAELTADSSIEQELAGVRGVDTPTMLTFEAGGLTIELEVLEQPGGSRRLLGQLVPPVAGEVEVRHRGGTVSVPADEVGRFDADGVAAGPVGLRCRVGETVVQTDWFLA